MISEAVPTVSDSEANKAVEDWIAKAKQSFQEFDVFIGIGGAGMPKSYLIEEDLENPDSGEDDDSVNVSEDGQDDYEFAVEHYDGKDHIKADVPLRHKASTSSISTSGTGTQARKRGSSKPAILPGEAAPFGLFGELSLKTSLKKRGSSAEAEAEEDRSPGIAGANFFRSSTFFNPYCQTYHI